MAGGNLDAVPLERAPKVAIYSPPNANPWDDAVTIALDYAGIPYTKVWDPEVIAGDLSKYDWLHLHHEDFTGQYNKFYISYRGSPWFINQVNRTVAQAKQLGFANVPALKKAVAEKMRHVRRERRVPVRDVRRHRDARAGDRRRRTSTSRAGSADGTPMDADADQKMDWTRAFAVQNAHLEPSPLINSMSDIDGHQVNVPGRRRALGTFTLFAFSAKLDPVPTMLTQDHRTVLPDFYGVTTSFTKSTLKPGTRVLAYEDGMPLAKYIHGSYGKGAWTFLGGHDPEDPQHEVGAAPTDLSLHPSSPGYRLILNNVLFPAAKKKPRKT